MKECSRVVEVVVRAGAFPPCSFLFLLALLLLARATAGVTSEPQHATNHLTWSHTPRVISSTSCLAEYTKDQEIKPQRLYVDEKEQPLTMLTSSRVPQQLMTRMVAIFLREWLGYVNLTITTVADTFDPGSVINAMKPVYIADNNPKSTTEVRIPKAMVSLEVWIPPGYNAESLTTDFETTSYLGSGGCFGWFLPKNLLARDFILDHWRSYTSPNSKALRMFSRTFEELQELSNKMKDPATGEFYCPDNLGCEKGMYTPPRCTPDQICAVLFASFADNNVTKFIRRQIETMKAYVRVVWIGPNLDHKFIEHNIHLPGPFERSVLIFHWRPSVLLQPFDVISVSFPPCIDRTVKTNEDPPYQCKYEMHRFHKFIWKKLKRYAKFAYDAFHKVQINHTDFMDLLSTYNSWKNKTPSTLDEVACHWMQNNENRWKTWKPKSTVHELRLVGLFPISATESEKHRFTAPGSVPAFFMAVEAVNNNKSILTDFYINPIVLNGACEPAMVMRQFIEILQGSSSLGFYNDMIGFVGPACSDTVEPIAGVSKYFNVPIISYGAEGAIFSDKDHYPYFFRTIPENKIFRHVYTHYFVHERWKRIASLTENGQRYSEYLTLLCDLLQDNGIELKTRKYFQERKAPVLTQYLQDLKDQNYYIIIGDFYQDVAREVICNAYHLQMTGYEGYLWFLPHWYSVGWYDTDQMPAYNKCTTAQMQRALQGHMSLSYKYFAEDSDIMQEGITVKEWRKKYSQRIQDTIKNASESDYAGFTYDAVWTYALALDKLFKEDQSYAADLRALNTTQAFMKQISSLSFNGVSGHINFSSGSSRVTDIIVWQFQDKQYVEVGRFHPDEGE